MYKKETVSIILPAFNEGKTISNFICEIKQLNFFDEIIAVDNASTDNTKKEILKNDVTYLFEERKGFGATVKRGLISSSTDIIFICEPDGSFDVKDFFKMIELSNEYDAIFTSRTECINKYYLKYGNILYAKFISLIFKGPVLSDVGSSLRLLRSKDLKKFIKNLNSDGPELQMELNINIMNLNVKIKELPIRYYQRIGKSNYTGNFFSSLKVALKFTKIVLLKFFNLI